MKTIPKQPKTTRAERRRNLADACLMRWQMSRKPVTPNHPDAGQRVVMGNGKHVYRIGPRGNYIRENPFKR